MSLAMFVRDRAHRLAGHARLRDPEAFLGPLRGGVGLEVGGPSADFAVGGRLPAYGALARVDGVQYAAETFWHGRMEAGEYHHGGPGGPGRLHILEGGDLGALPAGSYDAVLSSHVVEHLADPIGALRGWVRIVRPGGHLLLVVPHKEGSFDHRRPTTTLAHLREDAERGTGEDDATHVAEALALHDLSRDLPEMTHERRRVELADNLRTRLLHHHVFTTRTVLELLDELGLAIRAVEARWPHDVFALARRPAPGEPRPDHAALLAPGAPWSAASPFRADRRPA